MMNNETFFLWENRGKEIDVGWEEGRKAVSLQIVMLLSDTSVEVSDYQILHLLYCNAETIMTYFFCDSYTRISLFDVSRKIIILRIILLCATVWRVRLFILCFWKLSPSHPHPSHFFILTGSPYDSPLLNSLNQSESSSLCCCLACFLLNAKSEKSLFSVLHSSLQGYPDCTECVCVCVIWAVLLWL